MLVPLPFVSGSSTASLLEPGGKASNFVVPGTPSGDTTPAIVLLSNTKVTVCGSPTSFVGLCQVTLYPSLTSTL
ncbi:MAG TPA: hypothetical protein VGW09_11015 [Nitrososphaeraceae archaeon]|nr:hypothetical protein [Nitrososphaeraceae archaeon]